MKRFRLFVLIFCLLYPFGVSKADLPEMTSGWFPFEPYMHTEEHQGLSRLTGLDIKMLEAVLFHAGYKPAFSQVSWKEFLEDIRTGKRQIAPFATQTPEREKWGYFSIPYRWEEDVLYIKSGSTFSFKKNDVEDFITQMKKTGFRLGVMDGFFYPSEALNKFINDPANAHQIIKVKFDIDNINNLLLDKIDGFLTDRLVGATLIWRSGERKKFEEHLLNLKVPICFLMSKASVTPDIIEKINDAITKIKKSGEHAKIMRGYILPQLLMQTVDRPWFLWIEMMAIIAFVIAGMIIADRENFSVVATFGLAIVPSFGGGLLRDIIVNRYPVGMLVTPRYILTVLAAFFSILLLINIYDFFKYKMKFHKIDSLTPSRTTITRFVDILDAIGTSAFTVIGVLVAVMSKADPLWIWGPFFAVTTGIGGSTIRNALAGYRALGSHTTYSEIPLFCGFGLSLFLNAQTELIDPTRIFNVVVLTIAIGFICHVLISFFKVPSLKVHFFTRTKKRK
jgi:polar amino acid transport system substrate-binding protein